MKKQQRPFVVEIKSSRRRQLAGPRSIWSDSNLKAFAVGPNSDEQRLSKPIGSALDLDTGRDGDSVGLVVEIHTVDEAKDVPLLALKGDMQVDGQEPREKAGDCPDVPIAIDFEQISKNARQRRLWTPKAKRSRGKPAAEPFEKSEADELAELDAENRELKKLFQEQLIAENRLLREMLARQGS